MNHVSENCLGITEQSLRLSEQCLRGVEPSAWHGLSPPASPRAGGPPPGGYPSHLSSKGRWSLAFTEGRGRPRPRPRTAPCASSVGISQQRKEPAFRTEWRVRKAFGGAFLHALPSLNGGPSSIRLQNKNKSPSKKFYFSMKNLSCL